MSFRWLWALTALVACRPDEPSDDRDDSDPAEEAETETTPCAADDLVRAPAPVEVDGLYAVPVDIQSLDAAVVLDAYDGLAQAEATLTFAVGTEGGMPFLDLRQAPESIELDGEILDDDAFAPHDFTDAPNSELRVLARALEPCSTHTLTLS